MVHTRITKSGYFSTAKPVEICNILLQFVNPEHWHCTGLVHELWFSCIRILFSFSRILVENLQSVIWPKNSYS